MTDTMASILGILCLVLFCANMAQIFAFFTVVWWEGHIERREKALDNSAAKQAARFAKSERRYW